MEFPQLPWKEEEKAVAVIDEVAMEGRMRYNIIGFLKQFKSKHVVGDSESVRATYTLVAYNFIYATNFNGILFDR